jgi:flagellar basal-body rod protein FlgF
MGLIEIGEVIISRASQRVEVAAQNIANMTTAGYKARHQSFAAMTSIQDSSTVFAPAPDKAMIDFTGGKLQNTGNAFDLALAGRGFFVVRSGSETLYTRDGQFTRDADGHLVTANGALLQAGGGDVTVGAGAMTVLADGTIMQDGQPADRIAVADFADTAVLTDAGAGLFAAPSGAATDLATPAIRQGALETSNISTADEMLSVMAAMRGAESGQRVVQTYDDLMGRALTAFGQS